MAKLRLVGAVGIKVRPDTSGFKQEVDRALSRIPDDATVEINADLDIREVKRKLDRLEREENKRTLNLKVGVEYDTLMAAKRRVEAALADVKAKEIPIKMDEKSLNKAMGKIDKLLASSTLKIDVDPSNIDDLKRERQRIQDALSAVSSHVTLEVQNNKTSLEEAKHQLDELVEERTAKINPEVNEGLTAARLAYASRGRVVPFYVRIHERSLAIAEGILQSLAGINTLRESGKMLEQIVTKFDTISLKTGAIATGVGSIVDTVVFAASALLPIGEGILNLTGLLAFAPAAMSALTAGILINVAAFKDFKSAIDGNAKAMAGLPPEAQKTAKALQGTWKQIQEPVQNSFWKGMGDAMATSFQAFIPLVSKGLASSAEHVGRFGAGVFRAFEKISLAGGPLEQMLGNLSGFFDNAAGAAEPLFNAINILGLRGSEFLPRFGTYLTDMATRFDNWIRKADEAGKINVWMEQGVQALKDMWTMGGGVVKMFQGLTMAAKDAGAAGLGAVADEFSRIGDIMKGEPFQSRMATIFDGARSGASALNVGVKELGLTLGEASLFTGNLLSQLGKLGGQALSGLSKTIGNLTFQDGILKGLQGMSTLLDTLQPGFYNLGTVIGNLSSIAGTAFSSIGPVLNNVLSLLDIVIGKLEGNLSAMIPNLMGMVGGLVSSLSGPIELIADMLNGVLGFINSLPGPLANIATSALAFLLLAGKIGPMFDVAPDGWFSGMKKGFGEAEGAAGKFGSVVGSLKSGAMSLLGGPWGIAIGVLTTGFALAGQKAAEAKAQTDAYSQAIDQQTGKINANAQAMIAKAIVDDKQQAGVKSASETFRALGLSIEDVANITAEGGPVYDQLMAKLKGGSAAAKEMASGMDEAGRPIYGNADAWKAWAKEVGIGEDALNGLSLDGAIALLESQKGSLDANKASWLQRNDALTAGDQKMRDFNQAMTTYNDKTATADSRTRALKQALDLLNGKQPSLEEAQLRVNDAMRQAEGSLANVNGQMVLTGGAFRDAQGNVLNFNGVIDATSGKIDTASSAGANLYRNLKDTTDGVLGTVTAMKDAGAPVQDIAKYLDGARQQYVDMGVAAGLNADVVGKAYDHMIGANPKDLLTTITAVGVDEAKSRIDNYKGTLDSVNAYKAVAQIMGDDAVLGEKLANSYGSLAEFDKVVATATANLNPEQADSVRQRLINDLINLANTNPTVKANLDPAILDREREAVLARLRDLGNQKPTPEVKAETFDAQNQLRIIQGLIDGVKSKSVTMTITTEYLTKGNPVHGAGQAIQQADGGLWRNNVQQFANGGFYDPRAAKYFANGGIEQHIAQIARPSSVYRVWAEPETGGEAYIPLASSKRERSTAILNQVANQFGYNLAPMQTFADGGVVQGGNSKNAGLSVHIGTFNQNANDTVEDIGRGIMRQARNAGSTTLMEGF